MTRNTQHMYIYLMMLPRTKLWRDVHVQGSSVHTQVAYYLVAFLPPANEWIVDAITNTLRRQQKLIFVKQYLKSK